ncbi:MAG: ABC transporter ATP-binding protein, partial [Pseudomonadota bacterium]
MSLLELRDVHTHYGFAHVLQGVSLTVGEGEVVALLGRNGAGKTTTLKTIMGWLKPSSGSIQFAGQNMRGWPPDRICRAGLGFIPEDRRIFPELTVEENLRLGFYQDWRIGREERARRIGEIYSWLPRLEERRRQAGGSLSGGEQQMLAIARGIVGGPKVLLIDEPSEGLAPMIVHEVFESIRRMRNAGIAVLLVEQNV